MAAVAIATATLPLSATLNPLLFTTPSSSTAGIDTGFKPPLGPAADGNPKVFFELAAAGKPVGRVVMELKMDVAPKTAENFLQLCTGQNGFGCVFSSFLSSFFGGALPLPT